MKLPAEQSGLPRPASLRSTLLFQGLLNKNTVTFLAQCLRLSYLS